MRKNIRISIVISVVLVAFLLSFILYRTGVFKQWGSDMDGKDSYDLNIDVLNDSHPTDILVIGETIPFREALIYRTEDHVSVETLQTEKEHQIIVLSDLDGTLVISDEELLHIKDKLLSQQCDFYYLGTHLSEKLLELGFIENTWPTHDYCVAVVTEHGNICQYTGIWTESDKRATNDNRESLGHVLVTHFVHVLEVNYQ